MVFDARPFDLDATPPACVRKSQGQALDVIEDPRHHHMRRQRASNPPRCGTTMTMRAAVDDSGIDTGQVDWRAETETYFEAHPRETELWDLRAHLHTRPWTG